MADYQLYKLVHIVGGFTLFLAFGSVLSMDTARKVRWPGILHGISLLAILLAGLQMVRLLGIRGGLPNWILAKLMVWILLGGVLTIAKRKFLPSSLIVLLVSILGGIATYIALVHSL